MYIAAGNFKVLKIALRDIMAIFAVVTCYDTIY